MMKIVSNNLLKKKVMIT